MDGTTSDGTVSFIRMDEGTYDDYQLLNEQWKKHEGGVADEALGLLHRLAGDPMGYRIDRFQHSLQTATRAKRDGADDELVCCALLHDIGDTLAPNNHAQLAAAILRPYISEDNFWLVKHHGIFQGYFFWHHYGRDRNARDQYRGHPMFERTANFCEKWDQTAFDPTYDTIPLEAFEPMVRLLFSRPRPEFA
ncbi:MAG: HD domain-containing protein [Dongiaceae bacterium]